MSYLIFYPCCYGFTSLDTSLACLDTIILMLIGYCISKGFPNLDFFTFIGWLKHMAIYNLSEAN